MIKWLGRSDITRDHEQRTMQPSKLYWGAVANMLMGMFVFTSFTAVAAEVKVGYDPKRPYVLYILTDRFMRRIRK